MKKLLIATLLLLTAFMANADSDYLPKSSVAPIYPPSLENGFLSLTIDSAKQTSVLVYAPSIIWIEGKENKEAGKTFATLHMIEGNTVETHASLSEVFNLLHAKPYKTNE